MREDATRHNKAVLSHEKKLIEIIEPEEKRLEAIEKEAEQFAIRKDRLEKLPKRKERIANAGLMNYLEEGTDLDAILVDMDATVFEEYFIMLGREKEKHDKVIQEEARAAEQKKIDDENARIKADLDAKAKQIDDDKKKLEDEKRQFEADKLAAAGIAQRSVEVSAPEPTPEPDAPAPETVAPAADNKREEYKEFLKFHGYTSANAGDFKREETETEYVLFKKVGSFKK